MKTKKINPISTTLEQSIVKNNKQTKAQRNGTLSNMRLGLIFRRNIADIIVAIANNDPGIKTKRIVKYVNKELNSRKKDGEKQYDVGMRAITRAIKENIDLFPKSFIEKRRMDLDILPPIVHPDIVNEKTYIDNFFKKQDENYQDHKIFNE